MGFRGALVALLIAAQPASAATIDFLSLPPGDQDDNVIFVGSVGLVSDDSFFVFQSVFPAAGGAICGYDQSKGDCSENFSIFFNGKVKRLSFSPNSVNGTDRIVVGAFRGRTLLGSVTITDNTRVKMGSFGKITGLTFLDQSTGTSLFAFGKFQFTRLTTNRSAQGADPAQTTPVPVPAAAPLLAAGLLVLGWVARRRRRPTAPHSPG